jgi:methylenetetrahydrofolate reductase (NADPH)
MIKQYGGVPMAHCTIANQEFIDVDAFIKDLIKNKINKILCLRGDTEGNFTKHASDLMEYIKKNYSKYFEMFGAYYPEKHNENKNQNISVEIKNNFGNKTAAGCQKFISQCFFDNNIFLSVVKKIKAKYPNVELYAGIFPLLKYKNLTNIQTMCNCDIPNNITKYFEEHKHDEASLYNFGIKNTIKQIKSLIAHNFKNIHIFTMANENAIIQIMKGVSKCSK